MLAILFLVGSAWLGVCVVRRLLHDLVEGVEQIFWGIVVGWILTALAVYFAARWQGQLTWRLVLGATIIIWILSAGLSVIEWRRERLFLRTLWIDSHRYAGLLWLLVILAPIFFRLLQVQVFAHAAGGIYS